MSTQAEKPAVKKVTPKPRVKTLGVMVEQVFALRAKKATLESAVKAVAGELADLEVEVLERMKAEGIDKTAGKGGTISVGTSVVADVVDWDAFWTYVYKNKFGHLLQRRVSDPAWRELFEQKGKVPGTQPFTKTKLNVRSAS